MSITPVFRFGERGVISSSSAHGRGKTPSASLSFLPRFVSALGLPYETPRDASVHTIRSRHRPEAKWLCEFPTVLPLFGQNARPSFSEHPSALSGCRTRNTSHADCFCRAGETPLPPPGAQKSASRGPRPPIENQECL